MVAGIALKERFGATVLQGLLAALGVGEHLAHHSVGGLVLLFAQGEVGDVEGTLRKILVEVLGKTGKPQRARDACRSAKQIGFAACPQGKEPGERVTGDSAEAWGNGEGCFDRGNDLARKFR